MLILMCYCIALMVILMCYCTALMHYPECGGTLKSDF